MKAVVEFIDAKGGPAAIARKTGYSPGAVALWRFRKKLPRSAWPEIISAELATLDELKAMEPPAPGQRAA